MKTQFTVKYPTKIMWAFASDEQKQPYIHQAEFLREEYNRKKMGFISKEK